MKQVDIDFEYMLLLLSFSIESFKLENYTTEILICVGFFACKGKSGISYAKLDKFFFFLSFLPSFLPALPTIKDRFQGF